MFEIRTLSRKYFKLEYLTATTSVQLGLMLFKEISLISVYSENGKKHLNHVCEESEKLFNRVL
jgi:hypothetical protein